MCWKQDDWLPLAPLGRHNDAVDIAVNLVETYLRLNGYLTMSEFEVQRRLKDGRYNTVTDVDIVGLRFPGDIYAADTHDDAEAQMLLVEDPELRLGDEMIDVIIGEVKQGEAVFNEGLTRHEVLHTVLRRVEWVYGVPLEVVIGDLQGRLTSHVQARSGGHVRTRLVAFGQADATTENVIALAHVVEQVVGFMDRFDDVLRPAQFTEPAPALLHLLAKAGFTIT